MDSTLTFTQALQLAAIGPCIFLILYLCFASRNRRLIVVPVLYFISLTCSFLLPFLTAFPELDGPWLHATLLFNEHLIPEISFLFILQLILNAPPPAAYWLVLALPLVGGGPLLYLSLNAQQVCVAANGCIPAEDIMTLYRVVGSAVIFLLLVALLKRMPAIRKNDTIRQQKYWLIAMLILYSLLVMAVELARLAGWISGQDFTFVKTMIGLSFLYLVITSLFRVFNRNLGISPLISGLSARELELAHAIEDLLREEKPYCRLGYSRTKMADHFHVTEQQLSSVINRHFRQSFSELMNRYRIEDAMRLLKGTDAPVTTVSFDCGFSSVTSFNRVFREAVGMAPSEFRKSRGA